ncbi:TPA: fimbrial protein [Serratia marcescens]|nr:fimbrial protein [Serratia marcescens]MBN5381646.1 fimbrial protein [Serratia marcescens]
MKEGASKKIIFFLLGVFGFLLGGKGDAATTVTVKVTVLAALPCIINDNKPIDVDFGDEVMTTRIDGVNYSTPIKYTITCVNPQKNGMKLQVSGTSASFDSRLLKTDVDGLGIAFRSNESPLALNNWQSFNFPLLPRLAAVPVKQGSKVLPTGEFTSSATLRVDYQ